MSAAPSDTPERLEAAEARAAQDAKDAARYRFLREHMQSEERHVGEVWTRFQWTTRGQHLNLDAALAALPPSREEGK